MYASHWCATYLRAVIRVDGGKQLDTVVSRVRESGVQALLEGDLKQDQRIELDLIPRLHATPLRVRGTVVAVDPGEPHQRLDVILDPPLPTVEIELHDPPADVQELIAQEMGASRDGRRVVVVDDEPAHLWMVQSVLRRLGLDAICVHGPMGATNVIAESRPCLLLLDLNMPGLNGRDLCRLLQRDRRTREIPVVLFSAQPRPDLEAAAQEVGAVGFIEKGSDLQEFVSVVRRHVLA